MAGMFTSKRTLPHNLRVRSAFTDRPLVATTPEPIWGAWQNADSLWVGSPTQSTTSWRTGRQDSGISNEDDDLLNAKSYRERFRAYRKEYKERGGDRPSDTGHPFNTTLQTIVCSHPRVRLSRFDQYGSRIDYEGPLIPDFRHNEDPYRLQWKAAPAFNTGFYGPKAILNTMPTNPVSDLAVSLAELKREGIPSLVGHQSLMSGKGPSKNAGGEYLNYEFGWKPLIGAISDTMLAVSESARILRQYQRDSGRWVRRDYKFPEVVKTTRQEGRYVGPSALSQAGGSLYDFFTPASWDASRFHEESSSVENIYFKGAYSYFLQDDNSHLNRLYDFEQRANKLFGIRVTPEVLWNLQPWSWLVDWNLNIGDNIANASRLSADGMVIRYGYLMRTTTTTHTSTVTNLVSKRDNKPVGPISITWKQVSKERVRAEPYGFGSNPSSYTTRQWAILAALGMTKAPNVLK